MSVQASEVPAPESIREELRARAAGIPGLDALAEIIADAVHAKKKVRVAGCPGGRCDCKHIGYVEAHDLKLVRETFFDVVEQLEGRPGTAAVGNAAVVVRRVGPRVLSTEEG